MDDKIIQKASQWLGESYDEKTRKQVQQMMENDHEALTDAFYTNLEFGTGGMRGKMGAGTNRMNVYTVAMATQGLANYLLKSFPNEEIGLAVAYDCRHNNLLFAKTVADVLSANGIKVYVFDGIRPTPLLSFAIRHLKCKSGIVITASHNPKEYNGYKVYWEDGAQLVSPHDKNVIDEVLNIGDISEVKRDANPSLVLSVGKEIDDIFLKECKKQVFYPDISHKEKIKIVFTPLHGTGGVLIPQILQESGYTSFYPVEEQMVEDGDFPTAESPNPEEADALTLAINKARELNADIVMATDPDADRIGLAVKDEDNNYVLLNGNQTGAIIVKYILSQWKENGLFKGKEMTVKTIVTSELLKDISQSYGVKQYDVLTGFKWIADVIRRKEGEEVFIVGLEESFGYMIGDFVRDKDAVTAALLIAEIATYCRLQHKSLFDMLLDIYIEYGFYKEGLVNIYREGKKGAEEISVMMEAFRNNPPETFAGSSVVMLKDYLKGEAFDLTTANSILLDLPKSNVLQFITADGSKISVRPSGTEPKIKFYVSVKEKLESAADYRSVNAILDQKISQIAEQLGV